MERSAKNIHFDLITGNILHILPAKPLVRFMLACKTWYYLIKSPDFITTHLKVNRLDDKGHKILIIGKHSCSIVETQAVIQHIKPDFYIDYVGYSNTPIGSCNGLILIPTRLSNVREYLLWNPSIKKSKKLESKVYSPYYEKCDWVMFNHEIFGLGFHESSNDHRVVRILYVIDDRTSRIAHVPTEVDVYSLCTNSWHRVDSNPGQLIGYSRGVFVNGTSHWLATTRFTKITSNPEDDHLESILLFDFEDECFKEMTLPEDLHYTVNRTVAFNAFKGSLAAINWEVTPNSSMFVLWVLTDYAAVESWTKQFTIENKENRIDCWPLGLLRSGVLVYWQKQYGKMIIVFVDVDSGKAQNIEGLINSTEVMDFMDSLVLFEG